MSAQADPPVQKKTEETGGDSQPDVTLSSHNSMRAAAQVTCFSPRGLKHVTWAAALIEL